MTTPETARCQCGHNVISHQWMPATKTLKAGNRGPCSVQDSTGKCPCRSPR